VVLPLVVDQHLDQLVVHDLHVYLQSKDDLEDVLFFSLKKRPMNRFEKEAYIE
jgi:hypothetical protein